MRNSKYEIAHVKFYLIDMNIYLVLPGIKVVKKGYVNCSVNHCICKLFVEKKHNYCRCVLYKIYTTI